MFGFITHKCVGIRNFWITTLAPSEPIPVDKTLLAYMGNVFVMQQASFFWMWRHFHRYFDADSGHDIQRILSLLPDYSPFAGLYFIYTKLNWKNNRHRSVPWHFKHTFIVVYYGLIIFNLIKVAGIATLLGVGIILGTIDPCSLLTSQVWASFEPHSRLRGNVSLDYRHAPSYALSALSQGLVFVLALADLFLFDHFWPRHVFAMIPVTSMVTLLLYLSSENKHSDGLNEPIPVSVALIEDVDCICDICAATIFNHSESDRVKVRPADERYTWSKTYVYHVSVSSLQASALQGCRICSAAWQKRSRVPKDFLAPLTRRKPATTFTEIGDSVSIRFREDARQAYDYQFRMRGPQVPDRWVKSLDIQHRITDSPLSTHTGSIDSLDVAVKWFQHCTVFHGLCSANQDDQFQPSRLLCVANDLTRLHTKADMPSKVRYLTLSHCWGKVHLLRLLQSNLDSFCDNIPFSDLPPTFQDAVRITRHLGFAYIWIDSLCIIQDSAEDWKHEAQLMGKIYKNSMCNIAAPDSPDSEHGCLFPRNPRIIEPDMVLNYQEKNEPHFVISETDVYKNDHILYTRAWVLQEALLARRTLDCGHGQLFWRCGEVRASEVFPGGVPTNIFHDDHPASMFKAISAQNDQAILSANVLDQLLNSWKTKSQIPRAPGKGSLEHFTDAPFAFWSVIVGQYSAMKLTKDTDRLIALAGIADVFRPYFGDYSFGMWNIFMPSGLLWSTDGEAHEPSTVRAPTWSWMSLEGKVSCSLCEFKYRRDELLAQFIRVEPQNDNHMSLYLKAPLLQIKWSARSKPGRDSAITGIWGQPRSPYFSLSSWFPDSLGHISFDRSDDFEPEAKPDRIYCICIHISVNESSRKALGLVLLRLPNGQFRRIGVFNDYGGHVIPFVKRASQTEIVLV